MRARSISHTGTAVLIAVLSWAGVGAALVSQHVFDMQPCPWCTVQRLLFLLAGLFALLSVPVRQSSLRARLLLLVAGLLAAGALAAALHQHFVAAQTSSCALTAADRLMMATGLDELLPFLFKATAACDEANAPMLGVPYALWSAALAVMLLVLVARAMVRAGVRT
jgi:disulfide bond formation protein DsbB